jgi:hypothetical protein
MSFGLDPELPGDLYDPYAPPRSEIRHYKPSFRPGMVPFELGAVLAATWMIFKLRLGSCIAVSWTVLALLMASQYLQRLASERIAPDPGDRLSYFLVQFGAFFIAYAFNSWVTLGQNLALLGVARNAQPVFPLLIRGFPFLLTMLLAGILFGLAIGLIAMVCTIWVPILGGIFGPGSDGTMIVMTAAFVCTFLAAGYVAARLSQFHLMILDEHAGVVDSLRYSWEATRHHVATMILVWLLLIVINAGGLLACFVGLLFTIPFTSLMLTVTFLSLTHQPIGIDKGVPEKWGEFIE